MSDTAPTVPSQSVKSDSKTKNLLIFGALGVAAAIVFGLLYLFVLAPTVPGGSVGWFLFSFATGLTMIVMPCTLPLAFVIVPLSMGKGIVKGLGMALAFGLGVAAMLSTYGIIAALLGGFALDFLGNDIEPIKNWVYFIAGLFAFTFALGELGLINVHMPTYAGAAPAFIQKRGEFIKAFLLGLFLGNVGVGCPHPATPLILIEIASSGDIIYGWLMFLVHAIGRVLPLLLLAFMAILGVNGLNWLMARKEAVERVTGWGMVFVAGFILTLGLFTHDWWVNSGLHSALETLTQESYFNAWFNNALDQNVAHLHGLESGAGLFGQPLEWGHWFLVAVWLVPIWWWYAKRRNKLKVSPAFALQRLQHELDTVEGEIRAIEETVQIDAKDPSVDLKMIESQLDTLKSQRSALQSKVGYGEEGKLRNPESRNYEVKILGMQRNFLIVISIFLALVFAHYMPQNFYLKSTNPNMSDDHAAHMQDDADMGMGMAVGTPFSKSVVGLAEAKRTELVTLTDGESYDITASYVKKTVGNSVLRMMAYNESVPGPILNVAQGSEITINFTNETDIDQTIHSHGIRIDNLSDGVPNQTQYAVKPGESFTYTVVFEDAGAFWYHPHTRDDYGQELGLYGNYLVDPADPDYYSPVNREIPLVLDDILINDGQIEDFYKELTNFALLGRFGNEYLVNGEVDYTTTVNKGDVVRFYLTDVANARSFNLSIPGAKIKLVGADLGKYEREQFVESLLISPAERLIVEAYFPEAGSYKLLHTMPDGVVEIARFLALDSESEASYATAFNTLRTNESVVNELSPLRLFRNDEPDKNILLTIDLMDRMVDHSAHAHGAEEPTTDGHDDHAHDAPAAPMVDHSAHAHAGADAEGGDDRMASIQWDDATQSDNMNTTDTILWKIVDQDTGMANMDIDWTFTQGDLVKIRITNDPAADHVMQHPIHFHGQRFIVLTENGAPNDNLVWKDTTLVFPGETMDIVVDMSNSGEWMAHCHISEHLHAGMMLGFRVQDENGYATGDEFRASLPEMPTTEKPQTSQEVTSSNVASMQQDVTPLNTYVFSDTDRADILYKVTSQSRIAKAGRLESIQLTFTDAAGNPVNLSDVADPALNVTFIKSDNTVNFVSYPGNTIFPEVTDGKASDDHGTDDGHDHSHSFLSIPVAYAHGESIEDGHHVGNQMRTYSVPALFPERGVYRGYVEFVLNGETESRIAHFDVEVNGGGFSVDQFGWSDSTKRWILFVVSVILIVPLVLGVRRYIKVDKA